MADLKTNYMGIELKNPIIVGASNLVTDLSYLKKMEENGAAAIVYKSLFEEQIHLENLQMEEGLSEFEDRNAEMLRIFPDMEHSGPKAFLMQLRKARKAVSIPLFASLNAVYRETWGEYAEELEKTGVDGLELNFYANPQNLDRPGKEIVDEQLDIIREVKSRIKIPVAVKISPFYTNIPMVVKKMSEAGADAVILFNRFFQPDIDIESESHHFPYNLSNEEDNRLALRYAGLLYGNIDATICANTGIYQGSDVVKMMLAGAGAVQVVSALYKFQINHITKMLGELNAWMDKKGYANTEEFVGKLSRKNINDPFTYKRAQYIDILMKSEKIFKNHPTI